MLVLSRKCRESILVNGNILIDILNIEGRTVRIGITAPRSMPIERLDSSDNDRLEVVRGRTGE